MGILQCFEGFVGVIIGVITIILGIVGIIGGFLAQQHLLVVVCSPIQRSERPEE